MRHGYDCCCVKCLPPLPKLPRYLNSDGSDAGPGWINYKSPEKIAREAGTPETPSESISVHDGTKLTSGETPRALSAAEFYDKWADSNLGQAAWQHHWPDEMSAYAIKFADSFAADLREKLSTAERQYQSLVRCIDASDDDAQAVIRTLNERLSAAEAELARWREMIRNYVLSISGIPIAEGEDEVDFLIASHAALQERERKGE